MVAWIVWLIVAAVLGVAELVTFTFALGLIAVGACVAAAVAAVDARPALPAARVRRRLHGRTRPRPPRRPPARAAAARCSRPGPAALVGRPARVLEEVTGHSGRVRIGGEEWSARSYDETLVIPVGHTVDVMQIEGATALVYPRE